MKTSSIHQTVLRENAALLADARPLHDSQGLLDSLASECGMSCEKSVGNEWNTWLTPISEVARMLCDSAAMHRAEKAGLAPAGRVRTI